MYAWFVIVSLLFLPNALYAENATEVSFTASPKRCVTLREGQPCYARIRFEWRANEVVNLCVYAINGEQLSCWNPASRGRIVVPQTLVGSTVYVLMNDKGVEVSRAKVSVSWVYKKKRSNRRWRLF